MRRIDVMVEWGCYPVWLAHEDGGVDNVNPSDLDTPSELAQGLTGWARWWDEVFDPEYPPDTKFPTKAEEEEFLQQGERLARQLADVLQPDCPVIYSASGNVRIEVTTGTGSESGSF